jgi:hypothetical protein
MNIKIGQEIMHGGELFTIVDINHRQTPKGKVLHIMAYDPARADEEDQKRHKVEETNNNMLNMFKHLSEGKGGLGGFIFPPGEGE